jgi:hypothetical protein
MTIRVGVDLKELVEGKYLENVTKEYVLRAKTLRWKRKTKSP